MVPSTRSAGKAEALVNIWLVLIAIFNFSGRAEGLITSFTQGVKPNAGQPVMLVCGAEGDNAAPSGDSLTLNDPGGMLVPASDTSVTGNTRQTIFMPVVQETNTEYSCILLSSDGTTILDQQQLSVDIYELPYLLTPPSIRPNYLQLRQLIVTWLPWETDGAGDGPIVSYRVVYRHQGNATYVYSLAVNDTNTTSALVTDLAVDEFYDFAVVVVRVGEGGAGPPSNETTVKTACLEAPTMAPTITGVTALSHFELQVTWENPPRETWNCQQLDAFFIHYWQEGMMSYPSYASFKDGSSLVYNLTNLDACAMYGVRVFIGHTSYLYSPASASANGSTLQAVPSSVYISVETVPDTSSLRVYWTEFSAYNQRCAEHIYVTRTFLRLESCGNEAALVDTMTEVLPADARSIILANLTYYTTYNVSVVIGNKVGNSSVEFDVETTRQGLPGSVMGLRVASTEKYSARLEWNRIPCEDLAGQFYEYMLRFSNNVTGESFTEQVNDVDTTSLDQPYLLPCSTFDVQISVENQKHDGPYSESIRFTTLLEVPSSPQNVNVSSVPLHPDQLSARWDPPRDNNCPVDFYQISHQLVYRHQCEILDDQPHVIAANVSGTTTSDLITGLSPHSSYFVYLTAHNQAGSSTESIGSMSYTTAGQAPTAPPSSVRLSRSAEMLLAFSWLGPRCTATESSSRHLGYAYQLTDLSNNTTLPVTGEQGFENFITFENLAPFTRYAFQVRFRCADGKGPYSAPIEAMTFETVPGPPASLTVTEVNETTITVTWEAPLEPNGRILDYVVQYRAIEKPYDSSFVPPVVFTELSQLGPQVFTHTLIFLEPGTKYEIRVLALTSPGLGEPRVNLVFTKPKTDLQAPEQPLVDPSRSTDSSIFIYITGGDYTYVTSYLVAVRRVPARAKRTSIEIEGEVFGTYSENPDAYIAADLPKLERVQTFLVGDDKMYGNYLNAPLKEGTYSIMTGGVSQTDEASAISWSEPLIAAVNGMNSTLTSTPALPTTPATPPTGGDLSVGIIAAVLIAVILAIVIVSILILYLTKKRRRQADSRTSDTPMEARS